MASKKPLCNYGGKIKEIQAGDTVAGAGGGTFTALSDVPASYSGQTGKFVKVNAEETALEFAALAGGGDLLASNNLSDLANAGTARTNLGLGTVSTQAADSVDVTAINNGLKVKDTGGDHTLAIRPSEDLTANRTLSIIMGDSDRTLDLTTSSGLTQPQVMARSLGC